MGMGTNIRIKAEGDTCNLALGGCQFIDDFQFWNTLNIEAENVIVESGIDLPVAFAYTSIDDFPCRESTLDGGLDFTTTNTVST